MSVSYTEFVNQISESSTKRLPLDGTIELTSKCNLSCIHCYLNVSQNNQKDKLSDELTCEEIFNIIDNIVAEGCIRLVLTGGEPLLRKDFLDIYTYAKKQGLIIILFTNGTCITPQIADYLQKLPPFIIEISLYGATKETYELISKTPGSFDRCIQGIHLLKERNIPFRLKTILMNINQHELMDMKRLAKSVGDEDFTYNPFIFPRLDGSKEPCSFRIPPKLVVKLDIEDEARFESWKKLLQSLEITKTISSNKLHFCNAGNESFYIDSCGRLSMCYKSRSPYYNLRNGSFQEAWQDFLPYARTVNLDQEGSICCECYWQRVCPQCPVQSRLENYNSKQPRGYFCTVTKLRVETLLIKGGI